MPIKTAHEWRSEMSRTGHSVRFALEPLNHKDSEKHDSEHIEDVTSDDYYEGVPIHESEVRLVLPISKLVPTDFTKYYDADAYVGEPDAMHKGQRPDYTRRNLIDWEQNDIRSLLIVHELQPDWDNQVPLVLEPGFEVTLLPLDATNAQIVSELVASDIYTEHPISHAERIAMAQVAVECARNGASESEPLSLPAWRHMIENYLLNMGCEAQTRLDFQKLSHQLKKAKKASGSSITVEERIALWKCCQLALYRRLRLNWTPDDL